MNSTTVQTDVQRYRTLLEVSEAIARNRDVKGLFRDLAKRLPAVVRFEFIALLLHDPARNVMKTHILGTADADSASSGLELAMEDSAGGMVFKTQQPLVVSVREEETRFPKVTSVLRELGVESYCLLPLTTAVRRLGAIGFGSVRPRAFGDAELAYLGEIAQQVAVAVDNVLNFESAEAAQAQLREQRDRLALLLDVNNAVVTHLDLGDLFRAISDSLRKVIDHDGTALVLCDPETGRFRAHVLDFTNSSQFVEEGQRTSDHKAPDDVPCSIREPKIFLETDLRRFAVDSEVARRLLASGVKTLCSLPLLSHDRSLGAMNLGRRGEEGFDPAEIDLLSRVAEQIAMAVENAQSYRQIAELKEKLNKEKLYLEEEIRSERNFEEIIGESPALKRILKQVETVAPTDSTVLIQGETGTGKELVARAIHDLGGRRERTFVKMNCAAIPTGLLESELFGHEKGAFTGAIAQKIGRFELAHQGTLFLDEVGDIPLELQSKLLRVIQEQEFERLGSNKTIKVNVRLVAATNHDLARMVSEKTFRSDLFYRLNVFPITAPPLRERREDVPMLVRYFAQKFARRMNKRIETISADSLSALSSYSWPGNVRELQNLIERAVILSRGTELRVSASDLKSNPTPVDGPVATLESAERDHIQKALRESRGVVGGPNGAAARLGMKRTTLQSKIRKLGITVPSS